MQESTKKPESFIDNRNSSFASIPQPHILIGHAEGVAGFPSTVSTGRSNGLLRHRRLGLRRGEAQGRGLNGRFDRRPDDWFDDRGWRG